MDFSSLESGDVADAVETVAKGLLGHGVTSFCPTIVTSSPEYYSTVCLKRGEGQREKKERLIITGWPFGVCACPRPTCSEFFLCGRASMPVHVK